MYQQELQTAYNWANYVWKIPNAEYQKTWKIKKTEYVLIFLNRCSDITKGLYGENSKQHKNILKNIKDIQNAIVQNAMGYFKVGNYEKAAVMFEKEIPAIKKKFGEKDTINFTKQLLYTAVSFQHILNYEKAEKYYLQGISVYKSLKNSTNNHLYATFLNNLALLY